MRVMQPTSGSRTSSGQSPVLLAEDLRKSYGPRQALKGLSFSLEAGRILGFLGPNGAGKTTAIRILTTILEPSAGHFAVAGVRSDDPDGIRRRIGVLPESLGFHKHMTGLECLTYFGRLYGRTAADARENAQGLIKEVGLDQRSKSLVGTYSRGMRQRLGIGRALVNDPVVVFLDEPTLGLDPRGQQELLSLVRRIARERNVGIVLCSHVLADIEVVCDDVVILNSGQVVASGTVADMIGRSHHDGTAPNVIRIHVPPFAVADAQRALAAMSNVVRAAPEGENSSWLRVEFRKEEKENAGYDYHVNRILTGLIRADIPILSCEKEGSHLQEIFLRLTGAVV
jgi:ABC-2 type transport system ATP-binding protein